MAIFFKDSQDICQIIAERLRDHRLFQHKTQAELARQAGVSIGTVKNFEKNYQCSFENFTKIVFALGLQSSIENAFELKIQSLAEIEQIEKIKQKSKRKRAR